MNPAVIVALCSLGVAIMLQTATVAYFIGRLTQRVSSLEDDGSGHAGLAIQFAAFEGKMEAEMRNWVKSMEGLRQDLTWLRQGAFYEQEQVNKPRQRRNPNT